MPTEGGRASDGICRRNHARGSEESNTQNGETNKAKARGRRPQWLTSLPAVWMRGHRNDEDRDGEREGERLGRDGCWADGQAAGRGPRRKEGRGCRIAFSPSLPVPLSLLLSPPSPRTILRCHALTDEMRRGKRRKERSNTGWGQLKSWAALCERGFVDKASHKAGSDS